MATLRSLVDYGFQLAFGIGSPVPPATFNIPGGPSVTIGENKSEQWQQDAWRLWKQVGELHYPTTRLARQTSQLEWRVRINGRQLSPDSAKAEIETVTAGIGVQEATYLLALNDQVAGEEWYVESEPDRFEVWSVVEPDLDKKIARARSAGRINLRMHQPDPTNPRMADSSVRTAIGPAEEKLTLQDLSQSQARSRISQAGVLVTPAEARYGESDPWEADLVQAMTTAIKDVKSPAALAPIHVRLRRDLIEFIRYITFPRPYDDLIDRKIDRAVRSMALALDIEPELLLGIGDTSFWNAWAVSMDTYQAHIAPRADRIGNLYATVSERLRERAGQAVVVEITPDPRVMLARRSTVRDALDGWINGLVSAEYVRDAMGATEADAPSDEDKEWLLQVKGQAENMDRERRIGENPGPARSDPNNASVMSDLDVAFRARKAIGFALRDAWRNTPHRNRISGLEAPDFTCHIPLDDIAREFAIREVVGDAVREVALAHDVERLTSWVLENLLVPFSALQAMEEVNG